MSTEVNLILVERITPARKRGRPALVRSDMKMLVGLAGRERTAEKLVVFVAGSELGVAAVSQAALDFSVVKAVAAWCRQSSTSSTARRPIAFLFAAAFVFPAGSCHPTTWECDIG